MASPTTRHLSILLTDIKGFTDKTSQRSRVDIQRLLDDHRDAVLPVLQGKGGRLVKTIGDAFLMAFDSPTDAVLAGVAAQEALAKRNAGVAEADRIEIRIAINSGEVNLIEGDVFGEPVNIAARIEGVAEAGEVYFTEAVYLSMNKTEVPSSEVGLLQLKGIPEKIRVYKVRRETPLGVGQALPARAAAPAFAPGEKARLAGPEPAPRPAVLASAPLSRRAAALAIDAALCSMIAGFFTGAGLGARHMLNDAAAVVADVKPDKDGADFTLGNTRLRADKTGLRVLPGAPAPRAAADAPPQKPRRRDDDGDASFWFGGNGVLFAVWFVYTLVFLKRMNATPGGRIMKVKIVSEDGGEITKRQRLTRVFFSIVSAYFFFIGYLWALWEPQRRGWHDLIAGTRVVSAE